MCSCATNDSTPPVFHKTVCVCWLLSLSLLSAIIFTFVIPISSLQFFLLPAFNHQKLVLTPRFPTFDIDIKFCCNVSNNNFCGIVFLPMEVGFFPEMIDNLKFSWMTNKPLSCGNVGCHGYLWIVVFHFFSLHVPLCGLLFFCFWGLLSLLEDSFVFLHDCSLTVASGGGLFALLLVFCFCCICVFFFVTSSLVFTCCSTACSL